MIRSCWSATRSDGSPGSHSSPGSPEPPTSEAQTSTPSAEDTAPLAEPEAVVPEPLLTVPVFPELPELASPEILAAPNRVGPRVVTGAGVTMVVASAVIVLGPLRNANQTIADWNGTEYVTPDHIVDATVTAHRWNVVATGLAATGSAATIGGLLWSRHEARATSVSVGLAHGTPTLSLERHW